MIYVIFKKLQTKTYCILYSITPMKCLSIKQPFAELMATGNKTIELRTWNTRYRGEFLIHASNKVDHEICKLYKIDISRLVRGAVIGKAIIYDVKVYKSKKEFIADKNEHLAPEKYYDHKYGFMVKDAIKFQEPIYMKGRLGFFNIELWPKEKLAKGQLQLKNSQL